MKHFFTLGAQSEHVAICPHGPNKVSRLLSEQTIHSVNESGSVIAVAGLIGTTLVLLFVGELLK